MSRLAPPLPEPGRRPRSSVDVDRPQVDASILGIPQGWDDDLHVNVDSNHTVQSTSIDPRPIPLRHRIHLTSRATRSRTLLHSQIPIGRHDPAHVPIGDKPPGHGVPGPQSTQATKTSIQSSGAFKDDRQRGMFESSRKRHCGEGIYRVGYEREVLDIEARLHEAMYDMSESHCFAQFEQPPKAVLDIGIGLGLWPMSLSRVWKTTRFVGFDRAPCQVALKDIRGQWDTDRITWQQGDFLKPLPFGTGAFDYVHMRFIGLGIPEHAWPQLIEEACRVLKRGGKLEIVDMSYQLPLSARSLQDSFASLLLSDYIPDDPSRAIKFALPMIDTLLPTSIHPRMQRHFEVPPRALQDTLLGWISSALDYKSSAKEGCRTAAHTIANLGWGGAAVESVAQPLTVYAWVAVRV